jgi:hypothetical protein
MLKGYRFIRKITAQLMLLCISAAMLTACGKNTAAGENTVGETASDNSFSGDDGLVVSAGCAVTISTDKLYGMGAVYENTGDRLIIVTAAHVLQQAEYADITFLDGSVARTEEIYADELSDCGFVTINLTAEEMDTLKNTKSVIIDRNVFDRVSAGQGVFMADGNTDNDLRCRYAVLKDNWIYVEDFEEYMMLLSGEADAGMSGCGVFDENGVFLGILCGGNDSGELAVLPYSIIDAKYVEMSASQP